MRLLYSANLLLFFAFLWLVALLMHLGAVFSLVSQLRTSIPEVWRRVDPSGQRGVGAAIRSREFVGIIFSGDVSFSHMRLAIPRFAYISSVPLAFIATFGMFAVVLAEAWSVWSQGG